jgi:hypothetical protein
MSQNIYMAYVNVFDKYLDWPCVSVNKKYTQQQYNCKKFECVSVNDLHLHKIYNAIYTTIDMYTHNTTLDFRPCNFQ